MAAVKANPLQPENSTQILKLIIGLMAGDITAREAAKELAMVRAAPWLIASTISIEQQFADPDPDYCGPMSETVRKICGDV